jgi:hypothetical protein
MKSFKATIDIIGINPFVFLPETVLNRIFDQAQKNKGPIPVRGTIDGFPFIQTLVKYSGHWRLYINAPMLKVAHKNVGDTIKLTLLFDPADRSLTMHPKLKAALDKHKAAFKIFESLAPYLQKEIIRYIGNLKTEASIDKNVLRAIQFLLGKERFIGRDKP